MVKGVKKGVVIEQGDSVIVRDFFDLGQLTDSLLATSPRRGAEQLIILY